MGVRYYDATRAEIEQWSRIHSEGLLLLPLSVGRLWAGWFLDVGGGLLFRVARFSRIVRIEELGREELAAACFPAVAPESARDWWQGLPHGLQSRAVAVWVSTRRGLAPRKGMNRETNTASGSAGWDGVSVSRP